MTISSKGAHFPKGIILHCLLQPAPRVSYRNLEEIMAARGVKVDHATLNRWVVRYAGAGSWRCA